MGGMVSQASQHRPGVLSDLQRQVALRIAELPEAEGFALAGGAALIVRGNVVRQTRDLDFFGQQPDHVDTLFACRDSGAHRPRTRRERRSGGS